MDSNRAKLIDFQEINKSEGIFRCPICGSDMTNCEFCNNCGCMMESAVKHYQNMSAPVRASSVCPEVLPDTSFNQIVKWIKLRSKMPVQSVNQLIDIHAMHGAAHL